MADEFAQFGGYAIPDEEDEFAQFGGYAVPKAPETKSVPNAEQGFFQKLPKNILAGLGQFGHSLLNAPHNLTALVSPEAAESVPQFKPGFDYSEALGLPGTTADKIVQSVAKFAPSIAVPGLPLGAGPIAGAAGRIASQGLYGLATGEENPLGEAGAMAAGQGIAEALPLPFKAASAVSRAVRPQQHLEQILSELGGGQTVESNAKMLANSIKNNYQAAKKTGEELYADVFDRARDLSLREGRRGVEGEIGAIREKPSLSKEEIRSLKRNMGSLYKEFEGNPSLENAQKMQSALGSEIRHIQSMSKGKNLSLADRRELKRYKDAQESFKSYLVDSLKNIDKKAGNLPGEGVYDSYKSATKHWRENVVPYQSNRNLFKISEGRLKNPRNIGGIFKNPEAWTEKVAADLGPEGINRILYSQLGKYGASRTPEAFENAAKRLSEQGFEQYISPKLYSQLDTLSKRIKARDLVQGLGVGSLFGIAAKDMGLGKAANGAALLGGYASAPFAKPVWEGLSPATKTPMNKILSEALKKSYEKAGKHTVRGLIAVNPEE